jgi:8-oxo-dGTP pyrophosphatase MutT (NUDIX family)
MERLLTVFRSEGVDLSKPYRKRRACRAVVIRDGRILLVRTKMFGDLKFPGGGVEAGEHAFDTLARETLEETGYRLKRRIRPLGEIVEYDHGRHGEDVYCNVSHYYLCDVAGDPGPQCLSESEARLGFETVWMTAAEAAAANERVTPDPAIPWKKRETEMFKLLASGRFEK